MGREKGGSGRSKSRPSSSSLAAAHPGAMPLGFGGYVGSSLIERTLSAEREVSPDVDGEAALHLKRLSKRDPTTKLKALAALRAIFKEHSDTELAAILLSWNLICNGLVPAEDGKKMSKRLKNYPPSTDIIDEYGADALRLYLINSLVVKGEPLRFKKEGVYSVVKDVFLPWYNAYRFLVQNVKRLDAEGLEPFKPLDRTILQQSTNDLDRWINSGSQSLVAFVRQEMDAYRLYTVVPSLLKFIDNLTNIYVPLNRRRLKGRTGDDDSRVALSTLYFVLLTTVKAMAPFTPFFAEGMFQNLRRALPDVEESVHYCSFPEVESEITVDQMKAFSRQASLEK